tara:strand:- start:293 stop:1219 length:927 start_codon:yes stop_codon:yes gene_type:complete
MGFVRYEELPLTISVAGTSEDLYATNFTASENLPLTPVRALGYNGAVATTSTAPLDGSFSVSFAPGGVQQGGSSCKTTDGIRNGAAVINAPKKPFKAGEFVEVIIGLGSTIFSEGMATSFSISLEPNALITATLDGSIYDSLGIHGTTAVGNIVPDPARLADGAEAGGGAAMAHGSKSGPSAAVAALMGFSTDPFNATYTASRGLTPIYTVHELAPAFVMPTDPQESLSMQGDNLPTALLNNDLEIGSACISAINAAFSVSDYCGNVIYNTSQLAVCGFPQTRSIGLTTDDVLRGDVSLIDYNYPQEF